MSVTETQIQTCCFPDVLLPTDKMVDLSKSGDSVKLFNTISGLYGLAIQALEKLKNGELDDFDSLATDCSCHLRALRIAAIAQELFSSSSYLGEQLETTLKELKTKQIILKSIESDLIAWCSKGKKISGSLTPIVSAIQALQSEQKTSYSFSLQNTLDKLKVKVDLHEELAYVVHAYILALVKGYKPIEADDQVACADKNCGETLKIHHHIFKEVTYLKQLTQCVKAGNSNVNNNLIEKDVYRLAKKHLTNLSAKFLLQETKKLDHSDVYTFLNLNQKVVEGKVEFPDYYSLTSAFQVCMQRKIPILLKIKKCLHAHRYQELSTPFDVAIYLFPKEGKGFEPQFIPSNIPNGPVVVVEGKRSSKCIEDESVQNYVKRLMQDFDFLHFCQLDGAQHKQYTSDEDSLLQKPSQVIPLLQQEEYAFEAKRLDDFKTEAEESGCAFYNQSLLIFSHIFADTLQKQLKEYELFEQTAKWMGLDIKQQKMDGLT